MAFLAMLVLMFVLFGGLYILFSLVNFLTSSTPPGGRRGKRQSINFILAPVRKRFGAENLRATRVGELNFFRPALVFDYGRTMAKLKHFGSPLRSAGKRTVLETHFPLHGGGRILVVSQGEGMLEKPDALSRFETGDKDYDNEFVTYTDTPEVARQLLTDPVKWKMIELKNLQKSRISFELEKGILLTSCSQWFGSGQELLDFTQGGLELFDQLMLHNADGVEFLKENQAAVIEDFRCPICSDEVMHDMVICKRCKTPHCAECWEYNGKCATFACMEVRFIRVEEQEI